MPPANIRSVITIKVGGKKHEDMLDDLIMVTVDTNLHLPAMCTVELFDDTLEWIEDDAIELGKPVEISFEGQADPSETADPPPIVLFQGEITSIEPRFNDDGKATMLFRAYDKSHRLHRGKQTRTFLESTDSDVVSKIAKEAGLTPEVERTSIKFPYLIQNNQTNMEFLLERARRIGYWAFATKEKLYFKKPDFHLPGGPTLLWCDDLREFRPRLSGVGQPKDASALGWDFKAKKEIEGKATTATKFNPAGVSKAAGAAAEAAFKGKASVHILNRHVIDPGDAKTIAQAALDDAASEYLQADGECFGDAKVIAGAEVTIKGVGARFEGKYLVTAATHIYHSGRYITRFTMNGRNPNTLRFLLGGGGRNGASIDRAPADMPGVVVGVVTNTDDKDGMGRVKVEFPWMGKNAGAGIESAWARVSAPMAGKNRGFMFMPAVKDEVLVAFEHGDPNAPYILGGLWNTDDTVPLAKDEATKGGKTQQHMIKTASGHVLIFDDKSGNEQIVIRDKSTKNEIIINTKDNSIVINADKDISLTAKGNISFKADKDILLEGMNFKTTTKTDTTFEAANFKVEAKANVDFTGAKVGVEGKTGVMLKTAGMGKVDISPAKTSINAGGLDVM
jgi:uncharacterized protein involved in type VI secretion and phage assembly